MLRAHRIIEPGGIYHVTPRGNDGRDIFVDDVDRTGQLTLLARVVGKYRWVVSAYCLMGNHTHFLIQVSDTSLSQGMQELLSGYARRWNSRHGRSGHLFRNRFSARQVLTEAHYLAAARYIDLNPVRAGMVESADDWPWSSYRAHVGVAHPPPFLALNEFLPHFGPTPSEAHAAYREYVQQGHVPVSDAVG